MTRWWMLAAVWLLMPAVAETEAPLQPRQEEVPGRLADAYFGQRPKSFLVDPQQVLSRDDVVEHQEFLAYHAGDSAIDLYVMLFKGDQVLPAQVVPGDEVASAFRDGKPAVVIHYFIGRPDRAAIYVCPALGRVVTPAERLRALDSAIGRAKEESSVTAQLGKFLVEMSIRIYWMERLMERAAGGRAEEGEVVAMAPKELVVEPPSKREWLLGLAAPYAVPGGATVGGLLCIVLVRVLFKRRARYRFVDLDVEPRLGGAHAAGVGAVISFASAAVPPASQRER